VSKTEKVSRELLKKYDQPGPRYTSYPTVPEWLSEFGSEDYISALKKAAKSDWPLSLYFHIPFCRKRCAYCGCTTMVAGNSKVADDYILSLEKEMAIITNYLGGRKKVIQLHWGGGTPTYLNVEQIKDLFSKISGNFEIDNSGEIAIEVDPRVTTEAQVKILKELGFNRISMGVQDLTPQVQKAIGRGQTLEQTEALFRLCRNLGFTGINIDLIYGLPYQEVESFAATITKVIELGVDRVAVYSFAYLPGMRPHQKAILPDTLPAPARKYELFAAAVEEFTAAGYLQIGMDHFARKEDDLAKASSEGKLYRNFMGYTSRRAPDSIGFGMSAISEIGGVFAQNISQLTAYTKSIDDSRPATFRGRKLTLDDRIRQRAILSLMCNFVLKFDSLDREFGINSRHYFSLELSELKSFIDDGLISMDAEAIHVTNTGRILVRNIAMVFDAYLRSKGKKGKPTFSRTI
jgi:oxygen-independent coproporphyrinogen-3 oxidase